MDVEAIRSSHQPTYASAHYHPTTQLTAIHTLTTMADTKEIEQELPESIFNEFDEETSKKVGALTEAFDQAEADIIKYSTELYTPLYAQRDELAATIPKFWSTALINCFTMFRYVDEEDQAVLEHLQTIKLHRDAKDPRAVGIEFVFAPNEFFTNTTLRKDFELTKDSDKLPHFELSSDTTTKKVAIDWKSDEVNQCKKRPTKGSIEDDFEPGSFFSSFFDSDDVEIAGGIADQLVNDLYPRALEFYTGEACVL